MSSEPNDKTVFPEKIYVSGNPLFLRGFNGKYEYYKNEKTGLVEYRRDSHTMKVGCGPCLTQLFIRPTKIFKASKDQRWQLTTNDGASDDSWCLHVKRRVGDGTPLGDWGTILVTTHENFDTWWRNNGTYINNAIIILIVLAAIVWFFVK